MKTRSLSAIAALVATVASAQVPSTGITAIPGVKVGHSTLTERPTGCTVILLPPNTVGAVDQRGGAPATIETDLLRPENSVNVVHAVLLSGGSAYGLDAQGGVKKYLEEQKVGFLFGGAYVPIVPGAALFDLPVGGKPLIRPDASCGYDAARAARGGAIEEGSIGAGAGATVGKFGGGGRPMKGGIGTASLQLRNGLIVGALAAVNAAGTVIESRTGKPIAGARAADGTTVADPHALLREGTGLPGGLLENTTLVVVATNAKLTKAQALRVALMAQDGLARSIVPAHTTNDGDTVFVLATGSMSATGDPDLTRIGALAAEAVSDAIERSVRVAKGLPGYPSVSDLKK